MRRIKHSLQHGECVAVTAKVSMIDCVRSVLSIVFPFVLRWLCAVFCNRRHDAEFLVVPESN